MHKLFLEKLESLYLTSYIAMINLNETMFSSLLLYFRLVARKDTSELHLTWSGLIPFHYMFVM